MSNIVSNSEETLNQEEQAFSSKSTARRIQGTTFFLTFPQCSKAPSAVLKTFQDLVLEKTSKTLKWIVICQENHQTSMGLHLHLLFKLSGQVRYSTPAYWDWIASKHGNYSVVRNVVAAMKYTIKDNSYVHHGIDPTTWLKSKQTKKGSSYELVAKLLMEGTTLDQLTELHPGMVLRDLKKIQDFQQHLLSKRRRLEEEATLTTWLALDTLSLHQDFRILGTWLNNNLKVVRPFKQKQLWITGKTNMGKTSLIISLRKYLRVYTCPTNDRLDLYDDNGYDLVVMDEFRAKHHTATFLNKFVEGSHCSIKQIYKPDYIKKKNIPVIVLSNQTIDSCYWKLKTYYLDLFLALKARFTFVNVTHFITLPI